MLGAVKSPLISMLLTFSVAACARMEPSPGLVNTLELGSVRGAHYERVITHIHSPYSFDACDSKGINADGTLNANCLKDLKSALCTNHINLTFLTDHVNHMAQAEFSKLLLTEAGDTPVLKSGNPVANALNCSDGFQAVISPGLEGKLIALGMENHVSGTQAEREATYGGDSVVEKTKLKTETNAVVVVPHTESRDNAMLDTLNPDAIEIYNLHANLDPKIRKASLGLKPFEHIAKFMNYLLDLFNSQNADYLFVEFFQMSPVYFQKWNFLLSTRDQMTGLAAHDSHENIFPQKASDGERLDQHRRMTRMFSNLVLTNASDIDSIKTSIQSGQVFFVLEGLGSPVGMDFHGLLNSTVVELGSKMTVPGGATSKLIFKVPGVISSFPGMDSELKPIIYTELHRIDSSGIETVVKTSGETELIFDEPPAGHYRVHVYQYPFHLKDYVFKYSDVKRAYPWIISNTIKVVR